MTNALVKVEQAKIQAIDDTTSQCREIFAQKEDSESIGHELVLASAIGQLRSLLTDDVMTPIMALQNSALGFKTDKPDGGYPPDVVRDVMIEAKTMGARMRGNEVNIIAKGCYLTKNFFMRALNKYLGHGNWHFIHETPRGGNGGAVVKTKIIWSDSNGQHEQEVEHAIRGMGNATADLYLGKADRKCGKWLLENITGERFVDGDSDEATPVTPIIKPAAPTRPPVTVEADAEVKEDAPASTGFDHTQYDNPLDCGGAVLDYAMEKHGKKKLTAFLVKHNYLQPDQKPNDLSDDTVNTLGTHHERFLSALKDFEVE